MIFKRTRGKILVAVFLLALGGCSSPAFEPLPDNATILAFGDSLTYGVGASPADSYPAVLAEITGLKVINSGISGETTDEGLARLPGVLSATNPDLLILIEGGNDILQNKDLAQTKANLAAMIELANDNDIPVIFLGVPEKNLFSSSAPLYAEIARAHPIYFADSVIAELLRKPSFKSDLIHLNGVGYRRMAELVYELLQDSGAL
jgi:acyl-CoA thioesterase-1